VTFLVFRLHAHAGDFSSGWKFHLAGDVIKILTLMKFGIILFCLIVLLLLTAVLPVGGGLEATAIYYSPVMILLLALLSAGSVWCCLTRRAGRKQAGFYLVHLGVVVILAGAFVGYIAGVKGSLQLSVKQPVAANRLLLPERDSVELGFSVAAEDFQVKFYPPVYHLYRPTPSGMTAPGQMPFQKTGEFSADGQDEWILDDLGPFTASNLWSEARGEWTQRRMLDSGSFLHRASQTPSFFGVTLLVNGEKLPVSINHPAQYKGWRFYLVSYDQLNQSFVQLSARRDPGRTAVIAGIWVTMIGTFILGFRREKGGAA